MNVKIVKKFALTKEELLENLSEFGIKLNQYAEIIFESKSYNYLNDDEVIATSELTLNELGLTDGGTYSEIFEFIENHPVFDFCPLEFAPQIAMSYDDMKASFLNTKNQHPPESIIIFSRPILLEDDFPKGFYIRNIEGEKWLRGYLCSEDYFYKSDTEIIVKNN